MWNSSAQMGNLNGNFSISHLLNLPDASMRHSKAARALKSPSKVDLDTNEAEFRCQPESSMISHGG